VNRFLSTLLAASLLAGCSRSAGPLPNPPRVSACEPGHTGGKLSLGVAGSPKSFNPLYATDSASDCVVRLLFSSLVSLDLTTGDPTPGLAQSWSVDPDGKTWTFKLRQGLRWSDGQPLTADDVVFTWNDVMLNPAYNQISLDLFQSGGRMFTVSKVDDLTVRVVTPEVFAPFLEVFGIVAILPKHMLAQAAQDHSFPTAYGVRSLPQSIVGSGPYRLHEYRPGKYVVLDRNPEYCAVDRNGTRLPYFDEVTVVVTPNLREQAYRFLHHDTDAFETVPNDFRDLFEQDAATGRSKILELGAGIERDFFWFNQNTNVAPGGRPLVPPVKLKWFRDRRFRQAVSCAIDRERMVREVYGGRATSVYGFTSEENRRWFNTNAPQFRYDPDKARALLAEIGMRDRNADGTLKDADGNAVEITLLSSFENPVRGRMARLFQTDLAKVGIKVTYQAIDFPSLLRKINGTFDYEAALMGLGGGGLDPASDARVLKSDEPLHQWFPLQRRPSTDWEAKIDALMDDQVRTLDFRRRKTDFDEVQKILGEELPMIATVAPWTSSAIRSDLANVRPAISTGYHVTWNIEELYLRK
jgi:peptide/nickel transport system substrate-binding protein